MLKEQGTLFVGGKIEWRDPNTSVSDDVKFAAGDIAVNQMYVEYQVPEARKYDYPLVMIHGGGHTGAVYRTTPDGREGWFTSFTRRGFAVYVIDAPNRGRSGWDPTNRFAVTVGRKPPSALEPGNIYSAQTAWSAFRWGPAYPTPFADLQFPVGHLRDYLPQIVPSYRDNGQNDAIVHGLVALIHRVGPCILLGWSTGVGNAMIAGELESEKVKAIIALEGMPPDPARSKVDAAKLVGMPLLSILGDNVSGDESRVFTDKINMLGGNATTISLPDIGIIGNGHTMMLERNNEQIADLIEHWIGQHVPTDSE